MSDDALTHSDDSAAIVERPRAFDTILYGGLVVGILDGLFALIFYGLILGAKPLRIFQSVASGLIGKASYEGQPDTPIAFLSLFASDVTQHHPLAAISPK